MLNWEWYKWDRSTLEAQGLDKEMLAENEYFYVNYENGEIIYSKGTSFNNEDYMYSMTGLNYLLSNDVEEKN